MLRRVIHPETGFGCRRAGYPEIFSSFKSLLVEAGYPIVIARFAGHCMLAFVSNVVSYLCVRPARLLLTCHVHDLSEVDAQETLWMPMTPARSVLTSLSRASAQAGRRRSLYTSSVRTREDVAKNGPRLLQGDTPHLACASNGQRHTCEMRTRDTHNAWHPCATDSAV